MSNQRGSNPLLDIVEQHVQSSEAAIVITKVEGKPEAELLTHGEPREVARLMDALMRKFGLIQEGASA